MEHDVCLDWLGMGGGGAVVTANLFVNDRLSAVVKVAQQIWGWSRVMEWDSHEGEVNILQADSDSQWSRLESLVTIRVWFLLSYTQVLASVLARSGQVSVHK